MCNKKDRTIFYPAFRPIRRKFSDSVTRAGRVALHSPVIPAFAGMTDGAYCAPGATGCVAPGSTGAAGTS